MSIASSSNTSGGSRARRAWVQVHLWLGLTLGVVGALIGLSGSVLVFDDAIDEALNPQRYAISGPRIGLPYGEYAKRAGAALGAGARVAALRLPDREDGPVVVLARTGNGPFQRAYLDPEDGRVLDVASGRDWLGFLHAFHESLTLRDYSGREIVGAIGIAMLISSLSGIYLWWPIAGSRVSFGFRRGRALSRNLHYTFGFWGSLVLALLSFTGIFLAYPEAGRSTVAAFAPISASPRNVRATEGAGPMIDADAAVAVARDLYPAATVVGVGMPAGPRGAYRVSLREPGDDGPRPAAAVFVDPRTRAVLLRTDRSSRTAGDTFLAWQRILHEGSVFGPVWRTLVFAGGVLPPLLMITGLFIWLASSARKRRVRALAMATARGDD